MIEGINEIMEIRQAVTADLPDIQKVYDAARGFMRAHGNPTQWAGGYPQEELLLQDIEKKQLYVCVEKGQIVGSFAFIPGIDPTYLVIEQGDWHENRPYAAIHKVASNGQVKGVTRACFDFCSARCDYLRMDTHHDNLPMQNAMKKYGFRQCGIIHLADGSPRVAFDYLRKCSNDDKKET